MRKAYDFSRGKRGAVIPTPGKTRITILIGGDIMEAARDSASAIAGALMRAGRARWRGSVAARLRALGSAPRKWRSLTPGLTAVSVRRARVQD